MSIKIALAGNPNCGKTTLFNALTGSNQFVGNWPGVTVEKKEGKLKGHKDVAIMDLPGIYSLSPYTLEEVVARNYLINERPDAIINIVDGTNIERNLYLSTQIMELGIPVIMAVNMVDLLSRNGITLNTAQLSEKLGCEVVEISALKGTGINEAADKAVKLAQSKKLNKLAHKFSDEVESVIETVEGKIGLDVADEQKRFFAIKLLERDDKIGQLMTSVPDVSEEIAKLEKDFDDDTESIITNERYQYISEVIKGCYKKKNKEKLTIKEKVKSTTMLMLAVTLHNIPEGMAVGVAFAGLFSQNTGITLAEAFALAIGIAIQNIPEGAIISMPLHSSGKSKFKSFLGGTLSGIVEPIGAIITIALTRIVVPILPYFLSFAAGAMIYVVSSELIPEAQAEKKSNLVTISVGVGFVIMMLLDVALG